MAEVQAEMRKDLAESLQRLLNILRSEGGLTIREAYLYGSRASRDASKDSDIDVAIISPDLTGDQVQDWYRLNKLAKEVDVRMEVVGFRPEQFRDEHPLAWEVRKGIKVA